MYIYKCIHTYIYIYVYTYMYIYIYNVNSQIPQSKGVKEVDMTKSPRTIVRRGSLDSKMPVPHGLSYQDFFINKTTLDKSLLTLDKTPPQRILPRRSQSLLTSIFRYFNFLATF
jgi:hypothetical protein